MPTIVIDPEEGLREAYPGLIREVDTELGLAVVELEEFSTSETPFLKTIRLSKGRALLEKGIPYPRLGTMPLACDVAQPNLRVLCCSISSNIDLGIWAPAPGSSV